MRTSVFVSLAFLLITTAVLGQDFKSDLAEARKAFNYYNLDPMSNKAMLKTAVAAADRATSASEGQEDAFTAWLLKGQIYNEIATQLVTIRQLGLGNASELPQVNNPALDAFDAFRKARGLAQKPYEIMDVLRGIQACQGSLYNNGVFKYEEGDFAQAFRSFQAVLEAHEMLRNSGEKSTIDAVDAYNDQLYLTGLAALNANRMPEAGLYFRQLYELKYDKPAVYEAMYRIMAEEQSPEAAYPYLAAGRQKYPDDVSLLFADINHALRTNQTDQLIANLESAIRKEPENISLYTTAGSACEQLYRKSALAGDAAKAREYFDKALGYYQKGLKVDENSFDVVYGIASLHYNRAAAMTEQLNQQAEDPSAEGMKKSEALTAEILAQFDKALPYFQRCEMLNPNDANTLIALQEIYTRKQQPDLSNEFSRRLGTVQGGGSVNGSYFRNHQN
jgi:hypothetical protein